ncbi:MAG: AtpZ/AtpI family protein [Bacillota bacterium]
MVDERQKDGAGKDLPATVGHKAVRRLRARRTRDRAVWFGMGMFGLVGWTVAIYTILGIILGTWLDRRWPGSGYSWTLTALIAGLIAGILNAWYWVKKESRHDGVDGDGGEDA